MAHAMPQPAVAPQVAMPLAVEGHTEHCEPQDVTSLSETHCWPQACWPAGQTQVDVAVVQVAPEGHSELSLQPGLQVRVTGSQ